MDTRTVIIFFFALLVLIIAFWLITSFWRIGLRATYQTVKLPVKQVRKYRNSKKEHAFTVDYIEGSPDHKRMWIRKGNNSSVRPREAANAEVMIHTHPKTSRTGNSLEAAYDNELRERPSAADLSHLQFSERDQEFVMAPSGKLVRYEKTPAAENRNFFSKLLVSRKLSRAEITSQKQAMKNREIGSAKEAKQVAAESNELFLQEAKKQGFKTTIQKSDRIRTEVKD